MIVGLMITYNDCHFLKYSLPVLLKVVDKVIILDNSKDDSREYIQSLNNQNIKLFCEEDYPVMTFKERRQFTLDRGREVGGTHFIVIDADEILSEELIDYLNCGDWNNAIYCKWYHIGHDINLVNVDRIDNTQGIAFIDKGIDYHGKDMVHEDKIPINRDEEVCAFIDHPLLHFGMCNQSNVRTKESYYKCLGVLDGIPTYRINLDYLKICKNINYIYNYNLFTYPIPIDNRIIYEWKYNGTHRFWSIVKLYYEQFYDLDIWSEELILLCLLNCDEFDVDKIKVKTWYSNRYKLFLFFYSGLLYNIKQCDIKTIYRYTREVTGYFLGHFKYKVNKLLKG
jgi:hypothetical protein